MAKIVTWIIVLAVVVIGALAIFDRPADDGEVIKLGFIGPLTGDAVAYGEPLVQAAQVVIDEINAGGGVDGQLFELIVEDGKCDPQAAGTAAQKLVNVDGVKFILGGVCSGETLAAANITEPAEVILFSPSSTSPEVTGAGDFVFRTAPSDALAGRVAASYAINELELEAAAVFTELTDYSQAIRGVFTDAFANLGGVVVADETYATGDTDFKTQILKITEGEPDVVYFAPQSPTAGVSFVKQLRESGYEGVYFTAEVLLQRELISENPEILDNIYGVESAVDYEGNAKAHSFQDAHQETFGTDPGLFAANLHDIVHLLAEAIEAHGTDTIAIRDWLYEVDGWNGAIGPITLDENGDAILDLNVRLITGGEVTDLGPYAL